MDKSIKYLTAWLSFGFMAAPAQAAALNERGDVELTLPRMVAAGEAVWAQVKVGALARGAQVEFATAGGVPLESISPFGFRSAQQGGSYQIPLPAGAIVDGGVRLHVQIAQPGQAGRPPKAGEVEDVTLIFVPVTK